MAYEPKKRRSLYHQLLETGKSLLDDDGGDDDGDDHYDHDYDDYDDNASDYGDSINDTDNEVDYYYVEEYHVRDH